MELSSWIGGTKPRCPFYFLGYKDGSPFVVVPRPNAAIFGVLPAASGEIAPK